MAAMVPMGIDFWASRRSPERLDPAMIPEQKVRGRCYQGQCDLSTHARSLNTLGVREAAEYQSVSFIYLHKLSPKRTKKNIYISKSPLSKCVFTRHRGKVDSNQQRKEAGDVSQHKAVCIGQRVVLLFHRSHICFGNQVSLLIVGPEQVLCDGWERTVGFHPYINYNQYGCRKLRSRSDPSPRWAIAPVKIRNGVIFNYCAVCKGEQADRTLQFWEQTEKMWKKKTPSIVILSTVTNLMEKQHPGNCCFRLS